jgi:hypothetical protein
MRVSIFIHIIYIYISNTQPTHLVGIVPIVFAHKEEQIKVRWNL